MGSVSRRATLFAFAMGMLLLAAGVHAQVHGVLREVYVGLPGSSLNSFTNDSSFPNSPALSQVISDHFESPSNYGDRFGERYRALLLPPTSGYYVFWIQGDDAGALFLSPDESAFNRTQIAYNTNTALYRMWYTFPTQESAPVYLEAGRRYYIEALHSAGTGDDAMAVGWKLPNGTLEQPIPASRLLVFGQAPSTGPGIATQPTSISAVENAKVTFRVGVTNVDALGYQWRKNGAAIPGVRGASFTFTAAAGDHGAVFSCVVSNALGTATSGNATLSVTRDWTAPTIVSAANVDFQSIQILYSEPIEPASATNAGNYTLANTTAGGSVAISAARLGSTPRTVILTTAPLQRDAAFTLTINNVRDESLARNIIAANSQRNFTAALKGAYRELFEGIPGTRVSDLTSHETFPGAPVSAEILTGLLETTPHGANNYGQRLRALLQPPQSGTYTFWLAAHDSAELFLSPTAPANPNAAPTGTPIASVSTDSDVSARQWEVQPAQRSAAVALTAGVSYYLEVLSKGGVSVELPPDHMAVRWQLPDGSYDEPISTAFLTPRGLTAPVLAVQPASTNVVEGSEVFFQVSANTLVPISFQWQRNGTNLPGATNAILQISAVPLSLNGSTYRCLVSNAQGQTTSGTATLNVTADTTRPTVLQVANNSSNRIVITYSEPVDPATATSTANYSLPGKTLSAPALSTDGRVVTLNTTPLNYGETYTLIINRVRDRAATYNVVATNTQASFTAALFFLQAVGNAPAGSMTLAGQDVHLTAGNGSLSDTNDSFNFSYALRRGDFDVMVRVSRLDFADAWTMAGLMAREDTGTNSRYAAVFTTPSISGTFFQTRTTIGGLPQRVGSYPANLPYTWLRLQRTGGTTFTGYASRDGQVWTRLGTVNLPFSSTVYLGFTATSRNPDQSVMASFVDFGDTTSTNVGVPTATREPLGPSSRRTGLVITELMYHPPERADGRKLEFVELFNSNPFYEDLSNHRLTGDISYTFPPGTILPGGAFLVVARAPVDIKAVYGITNVVGPYTNNFSNSAGTVRLRGRGNEILLEVNYESRGQWPLAADGAGHSLVLTRPSYGEANVLAWGQSDQIGGSPGSMDGVGWEPVRSIMINEFLAHSDLPDVDYIELYNRGNTPVDLSGCWLSDDAETNKFRIPPGTIIGPTGFVYFTESQLGFGLGSDGEAIFLLNSNRTRVIDCIDFPAQENGVTTGRSPDGAPLFSRLASKTPGAKNSAHRSRDIVINEIMYRSVADDELDSFVELHNRSASAINLTGWRLNDGIQFDFPTNTMIPAGGYLVVAKDVARLLANYPTLNSGNTVGNYSGNLANSGERIALEMPDSVVSTNSNGLVRTNVIHIPVEEVTYGEGAGGKWGDWSDGGGSSLELIDPRADGRLPSNWADSDDSSKSGWTTITTTGLLDHAPGSDSKNNSFQVYLLDEGECLIDEVSVSIAGSGNLVTNAGFENGAANWFFQGTHRTSRIESSGSAGSRSLRLVATGRGDNGPNRVYSILNQSYTTGVVGTITAKVKWLHGRPEILLRLRNNPLELAGLLTIPKNLGTPGARNSRYITNAPPAITDTVHSPILPAANEPVYVTARVHDPDGLGAVQLVYRIDPFGSPITVSMADAGLNGDAVAGDGLFTGTIPGQPADTLVAFYVQATDSAGIPRTARFPKNAPTGECLVRFGEAQLPSAYATYRFWITQNSYNNWVVHEKLSNEENPGTFIYGNFRVIYDAGNRFGGSPFHQDLLDTPLGTNCDYYVTLPADDTLMGADSMTLQSPGNFGRDLTDQNEQTAYWMAREMRLPYLYRRSIHVFLNGIERGRIYEDTQQPDRDFNTEFFDDEGEGDLYKVQYHFEFNDTTDNATSIAASMQEFRTTGGVRKLSKYRHNFAKRAVNGSPHDHSTLFELVDTMNTSLTGDAYLARLNAEIDLEEWMNVFALERMLNNSDLYGNRKQSGNPGGQNCYIYRPVEDRWKFLIWDIDFCFSGSPTEHMFYFTDPPITNMCAQPAVLRQYYQALENLVYGPLDPAKAFPLMDARYNAMIANGIHAIPPDTTKRFIQVRHDYILQILTEARANFALSGPSSYTNASTLAELSGTAPLTVRRITVNGIDYPLSWQSITNWHVSLPLTGRTNLFVIRAYDVHGALLSNLTQNVTVYYNGPIARAEDSLAFNKIMYQPAVTNAEYVEIYNRSTNTTFSLLNFRVEGLDFNFPPGSFIEPNSYLVIAKDAQAFESAYGTGARIAGEFPGNLDRDGETLTLLRRAATTNATDTIIDKVKYEVAAPWPAASANGGIPLQLIDSAQDNARVSNWSDGLDWRFFSYTDQPGGSRLSIWLDAVGTLVIDDIRLVHGNVPGEGVNLVRNGDFEQPLSTGWAFSSSYQGNTTIRTEDARSGTNSLRLAPTKAGSSSTALYQDISPTPSSSSNFTLSFWYKPSTNLNNLTVRLGSSSYQQTINVRPAAAPPGEANPVAGTVTPYPLLWINEIQPHNTGAILDNTGSAQPWIELFNNSTNTISLEGLSLSKSYTNLAMWTFPAGAFILPGQFRVIFVDGQAHLSTGSVLHTSFRLDPTNGAIVLSRGSQILDYINYTGQRPGLSYGSKPDGQLFTRQLFFYVTPGASNNAAPVPVAINEYMASNTRTMIDPLTGAYEDWFELYNFHTEAVDLSGFYMTDDKNVRTKWRIPDGTIIAPRGFLLCWADDHIGNSTVGNALHASFKLDRAGDFLGLYTPDLQLVDGIDFRSQTSDVSEGRFPDGNVGGVLYKMTSSTPRNTNAITANAFSPVLQKPANFTINEGSRLSFTNRATDADLPPQQLTYSLGAGAPEGVQVDAITGLLTWQTVEAHGPGVYSITVIVSDNGSPLRTDSETFQVTVNESNTPPLIAPIDDQTTYAGTLVSVVIPVSDNDVPAQSFSYGMLSGPAGASVSSAGVFTWTPSGTYSGTTNIIVLTATDIAVPALSATQTFRVIVNAGSPCLGLKGDVVPRGAPNGSVSFSDWAQVGRFVAALNDLTDSCELARADAAPRPCGDGLLGITDWVQVGRYAAGLDSPVAELGNCGPAGAPPRPPKSGGPRALLIPNQSMVRGSTNFVSVLLNAQGDENALGFSVRFATNVLTFVSIQRGADAAQAQHFLVNTGGVERGEIGVALSLATEVVFPAGTQSVVTIGFTVNASAGNSPVTLALIDAPVRREISDALADPASATYHDGQITFQEPPFRFTSIARQPSGGVDLNMEGPTGVWDIVVSTNLSIWTPLSRITNSSGGIQYRDAGPGNASHRFYRALKQP